MTISAVGASGVASVQQTHHRGHRTDPSAQSAAGGSTVGTTAAAATDSATPQSGAAKFASELQSILLSAQSGQPSADGTTASDPSTASNPAGATDPTQASSGIKHLADRLQDLLGESGSTTTASTASGSTPLQDVLSRLQATLQQTLSKYQTATTAGAPSSSLTA